MTMRHMTIRYLRIALLLCATTLLAAGCANVVDPTTGLPPRKQAPESNLATMPGEDMDFSERSAGGGSSDPLLTAAKINHLKRENAALKNQQAEMRAKLEAMDTALAKEREEQKRFRETMAANFEMMEKSVAGNGGMERLGSPKPAPLQAAEPLMAPIDDGPVEGDDGSISQLAPPPLPGMGGAAVPLKQAAIPNDRGYDRGEDRIDLAELDALRVMEVKGRRSASYDDPDLIPPANPLPLTVSREAKPLYEKGFIFFAKGKFEDAIRIYSEFLRRFPNDRHSDNAQFWIGESHFRMSRMVQSEAAYRSVLRNYDHRSTLEGFKTPDSIYRLGQIHLKRNDPERAEYYFSNVVRRFPDSTAGRKAQREIDVIRVDTAAGQIGFQPDS